MSLQLNSNQPNIIKGKHQTSRKNKYAKVLVVICQVLALLSILENQLYNVNAIDLGNVIKKIGKNPSSTNNNNNKNDKDNNSNAVEVGASRTTARSNANTNTDASTGTVTTVEPGKERQPVSCNEFMAKAVVLASEEKELAFQERDNAVMEARRATDRANELAEIIDEAQAIAKNSTIEYEALKLMTDRLVQDIKMNAKIELDKKEEEHNSFVQELHDEMKDKKQQMVKDIEVVKKDSVNNIQRINDETEERIQKMEQKMVDEKRKSMEEINEMNMTAKKQMENMKISYENKEKEIRSKTNLQIELTTNQTSIEINNMAKQVEQITKDMDELKEATKIEIKTINYQKEEAIDNIQKESTTRELEADERAYQMERAKNEEMDELKKEMNRQLEQTYKKAEVTYEKIRDEASFELEKLRIDTADELDKKEKEMIKLTDLHTSKEKEMKDTIQSLQKNIQSLKDQSTALDGTLLDTTSELQYWKEIGTNPTYVNTTLIYADATIVVEQAMTEAKTRVNTMTDTISTKIHVVVLPYKNKFMDWYNNDDKTCKGHVVKGLVDKTLLPFYMDKIQPLGGKMDGLYQSHVSPLVHTFYHDHVQRVKNDIFTWLCHVSESIAGKVLVMLDGNGNGNGDGGKATKATATTKTPVVTFLEGMEDDSSKMVDMSIRTIAFIIIFIFRWVIFSIIWKLMKLPFQIVWFFSPLRLLFGGSSSSGSGKNTKQGRKGGIPSSPYRNGSSNGSVMKSDYSPIRSKVKLSGSPSRHQKSE